MRISRSAFTLAEMLIALAILGVIATFTIPKVLQSQQDTKFKAIAKEGAAMISGAYDAYKNEHPVTSATKTLDLTPYMNYVTIQTSDSVDKNYAETTFSCDPSSAMCLKLHNGAVLTLFDINFDGSATTNALLFYLDPDGIAQSTTDGPGKSVAFFLYKTGRITTYGNLEAGTHSSYGNHVACPGCDPPWFAWGN